MYMTKNNSKRHMWPLYDDVEISTNLRWHGQWGGTEGYWGSPEPSDPWVSSVVQPSGVVVESGSSEWGRRNVAAEGMWAQCSHLCFPAGKAEGEIDSGKIVKLEVLIREHL